MQTLSKVSLEDALIRTCELLEASEDSDWTSWTAKEVLTELTRILAAIRTEQNFDKKHLALLFGPTGAVQEILIANGWSNEMLRLANVVDSHTAGCFNRAQ